MVTWVEDMVPQAVSYFWREFCNTHGMKPICIHMTEYMMVADLDCFYARDVFRLHDKFRFTQSLPALGSY